MTDLETPLEGTVSQIKPWAIKAIEVSTIQAITDAAHAERITVGEWLTKRVREWTANGQAVVVVPKPPASLPAPPADDLADLDRILNMAGRLKHLGGPDAATLANMASRVMKARVGAMPGATARAKAVKPKAPDSSPEEPASGQPSNSG
jgi:hypothetical protein